MIYVLGLRATQVIKYALSASSSSIDQCTMPTCSPPPSTSHEPPSLPTSPLTKRPKTDMSSSSIQETPADDVTPPTPPPPPLTSSPPLLVKKLSAHAKTPTRGSAFAAGYDIYSAKECVIPSRGKGLVDTDISIAVGEGCCELVSPRPPIPPIPFTAYEDDGLGNLLICECRRW